MTRPNIPSQYTEDFPVGWVPQPRVNALSPERLRRLPPEQREKLAPMVEQFRKTKEINPLWDTYMRSQSHHEYASCPTLVGVCYAGNRYGKCQRLGTLVRMADGTVKAIEEIVAGEYVVGVGLDGETAPARVTASFSQGVKPVYRHTFSKRGYGVHFDATMDHKMLLSPATSENSKRRRKGYRVAPVKDAGQEWKTCMAKGYEQQSSGPDEEYALVVGLMLGDGHVPRMRARPMQFTNPEQSLVNAFNAEIESHGYRLRGHESNPIQWHIARPQGAGGRSPLRDKFEQFGLNVYSHEKTIPSFVDSWSNDAVSNLVAGLLSTDGSVHRHDQNWSVSYTSTSQNLTSTLHRLLAERFGVYGSQVTVHDRGDGSRPTYHFAVSNYWSLVRLHENVKLIGKRGELLEAALNGWSGKKSDGAELIYRGSEYIADEPTWDITIDNETHLFALENGLAVSNTSMAVLGSLINCVPMEWVPRHLMQYRRYLEDEPFFARITSPSLKDSAEKIIVPLLKRWVPRPTLIGGSWEKAYSKQNMMLRFKSGSFIELMSYDQDSDKHAGASRHGIWLDEPPPRDIWYESLARVTEYEGGFLRLGATMAKGIPSWFRREIHAKRKTSPHVSVYFGSIHDNDTVSAANKEAVLSMYSDKERKVREYGRLISLEGAVYDQFDRDKHVVQAIEPQQLKAHEGDIFIAIDPGIRNPAATFAIANDLKEEIFFFDEIYPRMSTMSVEIFTDLIKERMEHWLIQNPYFIIDPRADQRQQGTGETLIHEFNRHDIWPEQGNNSHELGIPRVNDLFLADKIYVGENCEEIIDQLETWSWSTTLEDAAGNAKAEQGGDDLVDCVRYTCVALPWGNDLQKKREAPPTDTLESMLEHYKINRGRRESQAAYSV